MTEINWFGFTIMILGIALSILSALKVTLDWMFLAGAIFGIGLVTSLKGGNNG